MPALSLARRATLLRAAGGGGGAGFTRVTGGVFNPVVLNKTTGLGGDYPTGVVGLAAGTWTFNPFSGLAGYTRAFDATKPNNNWLTIVEADGPGTVTFDMRADSTGSFSDSTGGGFWVTGTGGSLRWCFNGQFHWNNGSVRFDSDTVVDRIIWFNTNHTFPAAEWNRQNVATGGGNMKGGWEPCAFRFHRNATRMRILRVLIDEVSDDGVFVGGGSSLVDVIGAGISRVRATFGGGFHNDAVQITGINGFRVLDSTMLTASYQLVAEFQQNITNMVIDRCWQGLSSSASLGAVGLNGGSFSGTNQIAQGAPTTRLTGHYLKAFANGVDDHAAYPQVVFESGAVGNHVSIIDYGGHNAVINTGNASVSIPSGVGGGLDGNGLPINLESSINAALASADVPHQQFRAAYSASDLAAVMSDYGISYD